MYRHGNIDMETGEINFSAVRDMLLLGSSQDKETGEFIYSTSDDYFVEYKQNKFKIPTEYLKSPEEEFIQVKKIVVAEVPEDSEDTCPFSKMANKCHIKEVIRFAF